MPGLATPAPAVMASTKDHATGFQDTFDTTPSSIFAEDESSNFPGFSSPGSQEVSPREIEVEPPVEVTGGTSTQEELDNDMQPITAPSTMVPERTVPVRMPTVDLHAGTLSSVMAATFNLTNTVVGAGVLALPFVLSVTGVLCGVTMLGAVALLSYYALNILAHAGQRCNIFSYKGLVVHSYGKMAGDIFQTAILFFSCGTCVAYFDFLSEFIHSILDFYDITLPRGLLIVVIGIALLPMVSIRNVASLGMASFLAVSCVAFALFVLFFDLFNEGIAPSINWVVSITPEFLLAFPILSLAFSAQFNILPIFKSLKNRTFDNIQTVINSTSSITLALYAAFGLSGYLTYGDDTEGNVTENFSNSSIIALVARVGLTVTLYLSYPVIFFAARESTNLVFFPNKPPLYRRDLIIAYTGVFVTGLLAYLIPDISVVLAFNGAAFGQMVVSIGPGLIARRLLHDTPHAKYANLLIAIGVVLGVAGMVMAVLKMLGTEGAAHHGGG